MALSMTEGPRISVELSALIVALADPDIDEAVTLGFVRAYVADGLGWEMGPAMRLNGEGRQTMLDEIDALIVMHTEDAFAIEFVAAKTSDTRPIDR